MTGCLRNSASRWEQYIVLDPDDLTSLREQVAEARAKGEPFVIFGKEKVPIPATPETEHSLISLIGMVRPEISKPMPEPPRSQILKTRRQMPNMF